MSWTEFEKKLDNHADSIKNSITAPFDIESEELKMTEKFSKKRLLIVAAVIVFIVGTTVFATYNHYNKKLSAKDVANALGDDKLAQSFSENESGYETVTDGKYKATVLGIVSGENLANFKDTSWDAIPERTYVAVAVEKTDATPMTVGEPIMVTPLIQGLKPWQYNIASMHGGYMEDVIDGVLYRIIEMDSIECFANQKIYLAVTDSMFISNEHFAIDENSGEITAKEEYDGTNILFELAIDKSKADPEKATQYLIELKDGWNDETESIEENNTDNDSENIELVAD